MRRIKALEGQTIAAVDTTLRGSGEREKDVLLVVHFESGDMFVFSHEQYCCEDVCLEDGLEDLKGLVGGVVSYVEWTSSKDQPVDYGDEVWHFYKIATSKGYATLRFIGSSNGYYSTDVEEYLVRDGKWEEAPWE